MSIDLARSVLFVAGAAMLALAIVILLVRPARGLNRALAGLVAARGAATLLPQVSTDPAWMWTAITVQPYFALAVLPLAAYCLYAFTRADGAPPRRRAGWLALAAVALVDAAYFLDHSLVQTLRGGTAQVGALQAADGIVYAGFGPLWVIVGAVPLALTYLGLRLAVRYRQEPDGERGPVLLLVSGGLVLSGLFDGASRLAALTALLDQSAGFPWLPWGWAVVVLPVLALVPALLTLLVLAANPAPSLRPHRRMERMVFVLAAFAFFSGFLRLALPASSDAAGTAVALILLGVWRLSMPVLIAYAIVWHVGLPASGATAQPRPGRRRRAPLEPLDANPASR